MGVKRRLHNARASFTRKFGFARGRMRGRSDSGLSTKSLELIKETLGDNNNDTATTKSTPSSLTHRRVSLKKVVTAPPDSPMLCVNGVQVMPSTSSAPNNTAFGHKNTGRSTVSSSHEQTLNNHSGKVKSGTNKSRNQAEVGHTCRGAITLNNALVHTENATNFAVGCGTQVFHLKAANERERQKWVTALELARHRAIKKLESDEEEEIKLGKELNEGGDSRIDREGAIKIMNAKMADLQTCQAMLVKHGQSLHKTLTDLESQVVHSSDPDLAPRLKIANERATLFRITADAVLKVCSEFMQSAQTHNRRWQWLLEHEHQQRLQLQDQIEQLAKQHSVLERAAMTEGGTSGANHMPTTPVYSDSDEEVTFHDAAEELASLTVVGTETVAGKLHRSSSEVSADREPDDEQVRAVQLARAATEEYFQATIVTRPGMKSRDPSVDRDLAAQTSVSDSSQQMSKAAAAVKKSSVSKSSAPRQRRSSLPPRPVSSISLWSIMRNCIGKELSKIPMPVNFNEPLSFLQRITEDLEYASLLDRAQAKTTDSTEQMCYVAAFSVSMYSTTSNNRATKPFNPLLGETYECDRYDDLGWRSLAEQVSHHPPVAAHHVEGQAGWCMYQEFSMTSKFRGKYLSVIPTGVSHLTFENTGHHYTWRRVTTTVHNIIVGKLWIDHHGETTVENHLTGDKCIIKFQPYSYFSKETPRKVTAIVQDKHGKVRWLLQGTWDSHLDCMKVLSTDDQSTNKRIETDRAKRIWQRNPALPGAERFYHFTRLAVEMNEIEEGVAPTDSRQRPDQRFMEDGRWDEANAEKARLEEKQRTVRRQREEEHERAMLEGQPYEEYKPAWFSKKMDRWEGGVLHVYNGEYWPCKQRTDWARCPDIY